MRVLPVPVLELPWGSAIEPLHSMLVVPHLLSEETLQPLCPDAKLPIGLQLKVVIFSMIGVGAMNSRVQATPKQWGLS